jgi:hypothetical protein
MPDARPLGHHAADGQRATNVRNMPIMEYTDREFNHILRIWWLTSACIGMFWLTKL